MLVLSRRLGETIVIGCQIQVTLVAVRGNQVRLGIEAPPSIPVDRLEVHERREQGAHPAARGEPRLDRSRDPTAETGPRTSRRLEVRPREQLPILADFAEAIRLAPQDSGAYLGRGQFHQAEGDDDHAILDYTEAVRLDPRSVRAYRNRGTAHYNQGRDDLAIADYTETIRLDPEDAWTYHKRGLAHAKRGNYVSAIADFTEAIRLDPGTPAPYLDRACARCDREEHAAVIAGLDEVTQSCPTNPWAFGRLAWLLATSPEAELRDGQRAVAYARRACELSGWGHAGHLDSLAAAHAECGQYDEAVRWAAKAADVASQDQKPALGARLEMYQGHQPYREVER